MAERRFQGPVSEGGFSSRISLASLEFKVFPEHLLKYAAVNVQVSGSAAGIQKAPQSIYHRVLLVGSGR